MDQATYKHLEAFEVFLVSNVDYAAELNKSKQFREVVLPVDVQAETLRRSRFTRNGGYKLFSHNGVQLCTMRYVRDMCANCAFMPYRRFMLGLLP